MNEASSSPSKAATVPTPCDPRVQLAEALIE